MTREVTSEQMITALRQHIDTLTYENMMLKLLIQNLAADTEADETDPVTDPAG